jgi:hypothetical protein
VRDKIRENWKPFVAGVAFAVITYGIMRSTGLQRGPGVSKLQRGLTNTASLIFANQTVNITTVFDRDGRGHPGWPVQNLETKQIFPSQKSAADAIGAHESVMSGHIQGKLPDVHGLHFERVNLIPS